MTACFYVRDDGVVAQSVIVETTARHGGQLCLRVYAPNGDVLHEHHTER